MFFEVSQTEWREPFDFPAGFYGFSVQMITTPADFFKLARVRVRTITVAMVITKCETLILTTC